MLCAPHCRRLDQTSLFFHRYIIKPGSQTSRLSCFYFHERQIFRILSNNIDLAATDAEVALYDGIAQLFQSAANLRLSQATDLSCFHFHDSDIAFAKNWGDAPDMVRTAKSPHSVLLSRSPCALQNHTEDTSRPVHKASGLGRPRQNRRCGDRRRGCVPFHHSFRRNRKLRQTVAVDQHQSGLHRQSGNCTLHGEHGCSQDIQRFDFFDRCRCHASKPGRHFSLLRTAHPVSFPSSSCCHSSLRPAVWTGLKMTAAA